MLKIPRIVEEIKDGAFGTTSIPLKESRSAIQEMTTLLEGMRFNEMDPQYPEGKDVIRDHGQPLSNDLARIAVPQTPEGIVLAEYIKKARVSRN
jgi:hypothetical protein